MASASSSRERVLTELDRHGGYVRHGHLLEAGIDPHILSDMLAEGMLERVRRGLYRRAGPWSEQTALATVAAVVPEGVICLLSALDYYELTTVTPSEVYLAIPRKTRPPRIEYPPVRAIRYGEQIFAFGVTVQPLPEGKEVRIYTPEKTIADSFHFSRIVGHDIAMEALREYLRRPTRDIDALLAAATACRVLPRVTTYLEALL